MTRYILSGYSCYGYNDESGKFYNSYADGGTYTSYPVYVSIDEEQGTASVSGLIAENAQSPITNPTAAVGTYDKTTRTIRIKSPLTESPLDYCSLGNIFDEELLVLQAGFVYGVGYWRQTEDLVMKVSADGKRITPQSHFAGADAYEDDGEWEFDSWRYYDVIFNANLYEAGEGIRLLCSVDSLSLTAYPGHTVKQQIELFNSGDTDTDYAIGFDQPGFSTDQPAGTIKAGERLLLTVSFTAGSAELENGTLIVTTDADEFKLPCVGRIVPLPDYQSIVSQGAAYMQFDADDTYPWLLTDTITGSPVIVSSNKGVQKTASSMQLKVNVPEGHKGVLHVAGVYDPWFPVSNAYEQFTISKSGTVIFSAESPAEAFEKDITLPAGESALDFVYNKKSMVTGMFENGRDFTYLTDLSLVVEAVPDYRAELSQGHFDFGQFMVGQEPVGAQRNDLMLRNLGAKELQVNEIVGDGVFYGIVPEVNTVAPMDSIPLTIGFKTATAGEHEGKVTIRTNGGDYEVNCVAHVVAMPDFQSIVKEGDFTFDTDPDYPFLVADGKAYNSTAGKDDPCETYAWFTAYFDVPEGQMGKLTWAGRNDSQTGYEQWGLISDGTMINVDMNYPVMIGGHEKDAGYTVMMATDVFLLPGKHSVTFQYYQCGDSYSEGEDKVEISELSLHLFNMPTDSMVVWSQESFDSTYVGKISPAKATLVNIGSNDLQINAVKGDGVFDASLNMEHPFAQFATFDVSLTFAPTQKGQNQGKVTFETAAGVMELPLTGEALDDRQLIYYEDFENGADDWTFINDDACNSFFALTKVVDWTRRGERAIVSTSGNQCSNYAVSPEITIPQEGAVLNYYRRCNAGYTSECYDVLAGEGTDPKAFRSIYSEVVDKLQFQKGLPLYEKRSVDLSALAGKTIRFAFWHHDESSQYILLFDDLTVVSKADPTAITQLATGRTIKQVMYYSPAGVASAVPFKGVNIVRTVFTDGSSMVHSSFME
ncbi:MAG: choice-of-anchor D domain-containing protein [Alloprevotella sp.]